MSVTSSMLEIQGDDCERVWESSFLLLFISRLPQQQHNTFDANESSFELCFVSIFNSRQKKKKRLLLFNLYTTEWHAAMGSMRALFFCVSSQKRGVPVALCVQCSAVRAAIYNVHLPYVYCVLWLGLLYFTLYLTLLLCTLLYYYGVLCVRVAAGA